MSMYGKYPQVKVNGVFVEQNGLNGAPKAWPTTDCSKDKILTVQAPKDEVDINKIMARVAKGQMIGGLENGRFMDVSEYDGLEEAIIKVQKAKEEFLSLPVEIRDRFENDPVKLIDFLSDESNRAEAEELGLVNRQEPVQPASIPPAAGESAQKPT